MKTAKKIVALCLAVFMLAISMSATTLASGENDGSITIRDSESGEQVASRTFNIYKIFNATTSGTAISYQWYIPAGETKSPYYDFFYTNWNSKGVLLDPADGKGDSQERAAQYMRSLTTDDLIVLSVDFYEYIDIKGIEETDTKTAAANDINVQFTALEYGYYLIYDATSNPAMRAAVILTSVAPTSVVTLKAEKPAISKTFNGTQKNGSATIGDEISFEISAIVPNHQYFTNANDYQYIIKDEIPVSLTLDEESISIKKDGTELSEGTDYEIALEAQKITVTFKKILEYADGDKLTISYKATLNDDASPEAHTVNTATLTYSNDPTDSASTGTTSSSTDIHVYYLELTKVADENYNTVLTGAKFKLFRMVDGTQTPINLEKQSDGSYKAKVGTVSEALELESTGGKLKVSGLGAGNYSLLETVAPDGYKLPLASFEFTITETFASDGSSVLDGIAMENITTGNTFGKIIEPSGHISNTGTSDMGYVTFKLTNAAGTALPETGGMGTTLFTVGGILLMAIALGFFMLRRKDEVVC